MRFETVEVPFQTWGSHQVITDKQIAEQPWLAEFIKSYPKCFEYDHLKSVWFFYSRGGL